MERGQSHHVSRRAMLAGMGAAAAGVAAGATLATSQVAGAASGGSQNEGMAPASPGVQPGPTSRSCMRSRTRRR